MEQFRLPISDGKIQGGNLIFVGQEINVREQSRIKNLLYSGVVRIFMMMGKVQESSLTKWGDGSKLSQEYGEPFGRLKYA